MENKERYLIVIDLDGTLLWDYKTIDEETFTYLRYLKEQGHLIMIATGRPLRSSYFVYQALELSTPIINYNGARIFNPFDKDYPLIDLRIDRNALFSIINYAKPFLINVFCEIIDDIYIQSMNEDIYPYLHDENSYICEGYLQDTLPDNPNSAMFFLPKEYVKPFQKYVSEHYGNILLTRYWQTDKFHIVEMFNHQVDKKQGVIEAIKYYQIDPYHTIVIGDGENDIELFKIAHIKVAMKNANKLLFPYANYTTDSCFEQGVLKFLKKFFSH